MPLTDQERRVCDLIRARERAMLDDLRLQVGLPTGGGNLAALNETSERLGARAIALGARPTVVPGDPRPPWLYGETAATPLSTVVFSRHSTSTSRELLICGHLDTVHDPHGPFRELSIAPDGKTAVGPGCVDMKGGLVIALAALETLDEAGERINWTLLLNSDEETGSYHSASAIQSEAARVAASGGLGVALEPATSDGGLVIERAGSAQFMLEVHGKAAHVGRDFASGISAVNRLAEEILMLQSISEQWTGSHKLSDGLTINVGPLQGGAATNVVPDLARAWGNVRFANAESAMNFASILKGIAEGYSSPPDDRGKRTATVKTFMSFNRPAKPLTPEVQHFANIIRTAASDLNQPLPFSKTAGVCDGNLMQAAGLPTLDTLGVRGGGLHTPQEWIDLSSLVERCQLLAVTMMRACG
jgi:glutamate carboxypeptidase